MKILAIADKENSELNKALTILSMDNIQIKQYLDIDTLFINLLNLSTTEIVCILGDVGNSSEIDRYSICSRYPVILYGELEKGVDAIKKGVRLYISTPCSKEEFITQITTEIEGLKRDSEKQSVAQH